MMWLHVISYLTAGKRLQDPMAVTALMVGMTVLCSLGVVYVRAPVQKRSTAFLLVYMVACVGIVIDIALGRCTAPFARCAACHLRVSPALPAMLSCPLTVTVANLGSISPALIALKSVPSLHPSQSYAFCLMFRCIGGATARSVPSRLWCRSSVAGLSKLSVLRTSAEPNVHQLHTYCLELSCGCTALTRTARAQPILA
jgi:hypothetical protein